MGFKFNIDSIQPIEETDINNQNKIITRNGEYTADEGYTGLGTVTVNVEDIPAILEPLTVTPAVTAQTIRPTGTIEGFNPVNVSAVDASIDNNITANNIKDGVTILGVTGNYSGSSPTLVTKTITSNGTYNAIDDNADGYSSVRVNVSGSGGSLKYGVSIDSLLGNIDSQATLQPPTELFNAVFTGVEHLNVSFAYKFANTSIQSVSFPDLIDVSASAFNHAFENCTSLTSVDFSDLTAVSGAGVFSYAFSGCTSLSNVNLSSLTGSIPATFAHAFENCTNLNSVDLSGVTSISGAQQNAFSGCTSLTSVDFSGLTYIEGTQPFGACFTGCTSLNNVLFTNLERIGSPTYTSNNNRQFIECFKDCNLITLTFDNLESIYCDGSNTLGTFKDCNSIEKLYFPELRTITYGTGAASAQQKACQNIFSGCTALSEIHFGIVNESDIRNTAGFSTTWGATNATVYFDL